MQWTRDEARQCEQSRGREPLIEAVVGLHVVVDESSRVDEVERGGDLT